MAPNNLVDRLECAIAHINTSVDIDPWAQKLAVESMRMRITLIKSGQTEIIRCKDCIHKFDHDCPIDWGKTDSDFCSFAERRTDEPD